MAKFDWQEWLPLALKIWEIIKDGKFNYEDKEAAHDAVDIGIDEFNFPPKLMSIRKQWAYWIVEDIFWHMKKHPDLPDPIPVE